MVAAGHSKHVCNELCRNWRTRFVLLVHPGIGEARDNGCDAASGGTFACGDQDEKLHKVIVDVAAARLEDEDVFVSNGLRDLHVDLAIREFFDGAWGKQNIEPAFVNMQMNRKWSMNDGALSLADAAGVKGAAAHRSATAWASSGWLLPEHGFGLVRDQAKRIAKSLTREQSDGVSVKHLLGLVDY